MSTSAPLQSGRHVDFGPMKKRWLLLVPAVLVLGPLGYWVAKVNYSDFKASRTLLEYHVPSGFNGWIVIKYGVVGAPAIPFVPKGVGGTYTFRIPADGYLETSSPMLNDWHTDRYFRSDRGGAVLVAWTPPPFFLRESSTKTCQYIFVPVRALAHDQDTPPYPDHGCQ